MGPAVWVIGLMDFSMILFWLVQQEGIFSVIYERIIA